MVANDPPNSLDIIGLHCLPCKMLRDAALNIVEGRFDSRLDECKQKYDKAMRILNRRKTDIDKEYDREKQKCHNKCDTICFGLLICERTCQRACNVYIEAAYAPLYSVLETDYYIIDGLYDACRINATIDYQVERASVYATYVVCEATYGYDDKGCPCK